MTANVGTIDRLFRAALGLVLLYLAFFSGMGPFQAGALKYIAAIAGVVMLATAGMKFCPLYRIFGIKTCGI